MKRTILLILTNILLCSIASAQDWILSKDGKDLQTYYRASDKSDIKELKIVTTIAAPAITVFELLNEIDLYDDWVYRTTEARLVEKCAGENYLF